MEKKICGECKEAINDLEPLRCGFCEAFLHVTQTCLGFNSRGLKEAFAQRKVLIMCMTCRESLNGRSIQSYIADTHQPPSVPSDLKDLPAQVSQLSNVVKALSTKFDNFTCTQPQPQSQPVWPTLNTTPVWPKRSVKRRRFDDKINTQVPTDCGTNNVDFSDLSVPSVVQNANKFWLYLSGLNPLITDGDVQKIVSRCLSATEPIDLVRLVPKGKDVAGLSFVSFKIGLDPDMKIKALDSSSWPVGLRFREFVDRSKNWNRQRDQPTPE